MITFYLLQGKHENFPKLPEPHGLLCWGETAERAHSAKHWHTQFLGFSGHKTSASQMIPQVAVIFRVEKKNVKIPLKNSKCQVGEMLSG